MRIVPVAEVAAAGWTGLMPGRDEVVPDIGTRIGLRALRFLPWRLVARTPASPRSIAEVLAQR